MADFDYYDFGLVESYDGLFTMVAGARGLGKTYGATRAAIRRNIKSGEEFIYMRRWKTELGKVKQTFFSAVEHEFPDWEFRVNGDVGERAHVSTRDDTKRVWHPVCTFLALSVAHNIKSASFPTVTRIIFDECIPDDGRYIRNEVTALINVLSTVDRYQDRARVMMLSNAVSIMNPYFAEWGIEPAQAGKNGIIRAQKGAVIVHLPDSRRFGEQVRKTRLGRFIADSEYASYAIDNVFSDNHAVLVGEKPPSARYAYTLRTAGGYMSMWEDMAGDSWYAQAKRPGDEQIVTLRPELVTEDVHMVAPRSMMISRARRAYERGEMYFDSPRTRNLFIEMGKR